MNSKDAWQAAQDAFLIEADAVEKALSRHFGSGTSCARLTCLPKPSASAAAGCGHSGIVCQHFAHLMCCIERPARFISPAEAVHGATGFLKKGDVMVFASRGGKTKELLPILDICKKKEELR